MTNQPTKSVTSILSIYYQLTSFELDTFSGKMVEDAVIVSTLDPSVGVAGQRHAKVSYLEQSASLQRRR